ncbi:MAG TPA: ABC transporter substrate-binding protein [Lacipirellulaceae bacterium]|nr:ABC transporter substrate-binding protein [Lacipirellulaceae bacterium]
MSSPPRLPVLPRRLPCVSLVAAIALWAFVPAAGAQDRVTLALNWKAQPELGGFYQALADGSYRDAGLEVTIKQGGPMVNNRPLLAFDQVDFLIATNLLPPFDAVKQGIPSKVVAAFLQKDPQCLLAHPDAPYAAWDDLKTAPLFMANTGRLSFFRWLESAHGFQRAKLRPYNHNLTPFLVDKTAVMQGYATAEPQRVREALGREPRVFLLADHGWKSYSTLLEARTALIERNPALVQRFVDASIRGWARYLYGADAEVEAANALIIRDNPAITPSQIEFSRRQMRVAGLVDSGDSLERGIGAIDPRRVSAFYATMVAAGMYQEGDLNPAAAVTTQFVNKGVGRELAPKP